MAVSADWVPPEAPAGDGPRFIDSDDPRYDERYDGVCVAAHFGAWCYGPAIDPPDEGVWDEPPSAAALRREAVRILHTEPLPSLTPRIDPGWGIVGKQMFLETGATMAFGPQTRQTAFGPLQLAAASVVYVDWGDGHVSGPLEGPGEPWPDGTITHAWRDAGHYWVVVWQYWAVNWRLDWEVLVRTWAVDEDGNEVEGPPELVSGTLTGQELLTGMNWLDDGFPVRELQAVRHH